MSGMRTVNFNCVLAGLNNEISYPIDFPLYCENNEITELAHRIVAEHSIGLNFLDLDTGNVAHSCFIQQMIGLQYPSKDEQVKKALTTFVQVQNQLYFDDNNETLLSDARAGAIDFDMVIKDKEKIYKDEILDFADRSDSNYNWSDKEIFAQSFHHLVHSSSLPELLAQEKAYAKIISDMMQKMNNELEELNTVQQNEMEKEIQQLELSNNSDIDINNLLSRQYHVSLNFEDFYMDEKCCAYCKLLLAGFKLCPPEVGVGDLVKARTFIYFIP
jgi:Uncharacterised conserved protein (DUF2362)